MKQRKGLGKGLGTGYKNLAPLDSHIHSLSAKGVKTMSKKKFHTYSLKNPSLDFSQAPHEKYGADELYAKKKLNVWQKIGLQDKPRRGRPEKREEVKIIMNIPMGLTEEDKKRVEREDKVKALTKRQKTIGLYNMLGAGAGYSIGGLLGGLSGMWIGVPIGTMVGFTIGRLKAGKPRGRKPTVRRYKSQLVTDLWMTREEQLEFRRKTKEDAKKEAKKNEKK